MKILLVLILFPALLFSQIGNMMKGLDDTQKKIVLNLIKEDAKVALFSVQHQLYLDSILIFLPKEAFLWQQKAMPLFKQRKYELGMTYLDKAVELDTTNHYREYRAFIKCIFQKSYLEALHEFEELSKVNQDGVVMDHTYSFWMALCCLQLNKFGLSKQYMEKGVAFGKKHNIVNPYEMFYLGIIEYETGNYSKAIEYLNASLLHYKNFADAKYYKALALAKMNKQEEAEKLFRESEKNFKEGYSFNEGNSLYEMFPYQVSEVTYKYTEAFFSK
ncbi:tetratricopeptide repeat protein [Chryseobacterium sp. 2987]|uniref:tetratricopeptide repeat protein n=1 Tax=Chryseobacterium sp. 2987 TaxID=2817767 RepID=UPI0028660305|nr:tetratricopeptide repeat protein [Chryseobacterium sp. 2987]MDR6919206.1 tetratricopeptide (TPR) repeat protein [Chryseobacterium sp. 2987]